jgi:succinate dehydrogenase hydrophobic anchor subunit
VFLWVIQSWTYVAYSWNIPKWQSLFSQLSNLALFFTWPVAIFFLVYGGFLYITSAWDEGKAKKWTTIIKNTFIAVIILLASYAFLKDLWDFKL